ncbi:MAG: aminotransferase class III-fold pyridoxal phosphate-dependent enzyme, partial [Pseudomonadales bacterium]
LVENANEVGTYLTQGLAQLADRYELIGDVRGQGLFFGVELVQDRETKAPATDEAGRLINFMKEHGVLISKIGRYDNILKMRPPLCFSRDNADLLLSNLDLAFAQL